MGKNHSPQLGKLMLVEEMTRRRPQAAYGHQSIRLTPHLGGQGWDHDLWVGRPAKAEQTGMDPSLASQGTRAEMASKSSRAF